MAGCVGNTCTKNYQNLIIDFQATVEIVGDAFLGHGVVFIRNLFENSKYLLH